MALRTCGQCVHCGDDVLGTRSYSQHGNVCASCQAIFVQHPALAQWFLKLIDAKLEGIKLELQNDLRRAIRSKDDYDD